jgi:predicted NBD/HSP70 family sugar kinase
MTPPKHTAPKTPKKILVVDVGGTNVKLMHSDSADRIKICSGPDFTPRQLMAGIRKFAADWEFDAVTVGLPIPIVNGKPVREPNNLGRGWLRFDYEKVFGKPVRLINDAAMQALGSYEGGRMLFIGLGTGLGSAMILDYVLIPLELGELSYSPRRTFEGMLGKAGRKRLGQKRWEEALERIIAILHMGFVPDYIVIGGGNARRVKHLPRGTKLGDNRNAYIGGLRLWGHGAGGLDRKSHELVLR